ncbi:Tetratricopeptide repeat 28, partial [Paramuricea clavata]
MENGRVDLSSEELAESLLSFVENDDSSHCELNVESSLNAVNSLYSYFCYKKNKLKWAGSLEDLKAVVLTVVDEQTAETTTWRSPSGGTWKFDSNALCVTWQTKSQNIYFEGENGKEVTKRIISHLNQGVHASLKAYSLEGKATETEPRLTELISDSCCQNYKQLNEDCREITIENGDVVNENADISSVEYRGKTDVTMASTRCINTSSQVIVNKSSGALHNEEENNTLKEKFNNYSLDYSCTISDLKTKIENIENEKLSLITAIKLLQDDNNSRSANNKQSTCSTWQVHSKPSSRKIPATHVQNKPFTPTVINNQPREVTTSENRFELLSHTIDNDEKFNTVESSNESNTPSDKAKFKDRNRPDNNTGEKSGKLAFIAGDSILQHVHGWELSSDEQRVSVKAFSGSRVEDMQDYIKPLIRKKPDTMILHVGTNDIKDDTKSAEVVAAGVLNL